MRKIIIWLVGLHGWRVSEFTRHVCAFERRPADQRAMLFVAALVHDASALQTTRIVAERLSTPRPCAHGGPPSVVGRASLSDSTASGDACMLATPSPSEEHRPP